MRLLFILYFIILFWVEAFDDDFSEGSFKKKVKKVDPVEGKVILRVNNEVPGLLKTVRGIYLAFLPRFEKESRYHQSVTEDPAFELWFLQAQNKRGEIEKKYEFKTINRFRDGYSQKDEGPVIDAIYFKEEEKKEGPKLWRFEEMKRKEKSEQEKK